MDRSPPTVAYVERQPALGRHFSIERVFDAIYAASLDSLSLRRVRVPRSGIRPMALVANAYAARSVRADVIHVTGDVHYVLPLLPHASVRVLTIHDLASLNRTKGLRRRMIRWFWYSLPLKQADAVTTVSQETRRQLIAEFHGIADKVTVVENPLTAPFAQAHARPVREIGPPTSCVVLAVGTGANKNLLRTAEAVRRIGASLRVIGKLDEDSMARLVEIGVDFDSTHSLSDEELLEEYRRADVLAFPSLHEGFGLPILEAQAVGLPVITSNIPPMSEVAGGGALLVDPYEAQEIAEAILAVCEKRDLRVRLHAAGLDNVRRHAPDEVAGHYAGLYRLLLANRKVTSGE